MTTTTAPAPPSASPRLTLRRVGADSLYVLTGFPIALLSFVLVVSGVALGGGLLITLLGVPVLAVTLEAARGFAAYERGRLRQVLGITTPAPEYRSRSADAVSGMFTMLRDRQRWLDAAHGVAQFVVATVTWSVGVAWWAGAIAGPLYVTWFWALPDDDPLQRDTPLEFIGIDSTLVDVTFHTTLGVIMLFTLPFVIRACVNAQAHLGRRLLFGERVSTLQARVDTLAASRAAVVDAEAQGLRRLERDLHDGPQQRLVRLTMDLSAAQRRIASGDTEQAGPLVAEALSQATDALQELRALSRGIAPPILADRGLAAALGAAAARCPAPVELDVDMPEGRRLAAPVETTAYFVVTEALTNVAKHSGASRAQVVVRLAADTLEVRVTDDGRGGAHPAKGHGLAGLADRVAALDGRLEVDSPEGGPTTVTATLPGV